MDAVMARRGFEFAVENIYANSKLEREKYSGAD
jgi:hypothetical protein